jgi:hypothetical protein
MTNDACTLLRTEIASGCTGGRAQASSARRARPDRSENRVVPVAAVVLDVLSACTVPANDR